MPSAEEHTNAQPLVGAGVAIHADPELVETYTRPPSTTPTNLLPSAELATEVQFVMGALVWTQFWADPGRTRPNTRAVSRTSIAFIGPNVDALWRGAKKARTPT